MYCFPVVLACVLFHLFYLYAPGILKDVSLHFQLTHEIFDNHILINISSVSALVFLIPSFDMQQLANTWKIKMLMHPTGSAFLSEVKSELLSEKKNPKQNNS